MYYILTTILLAAFYANASVMDVTINGNLVESIIGAMSDASSPFDQCIPCKTETTTAKVYSTSVQIDTIIRVKSDGTFYDVSKIQTISFSNKVATLLVNFDYSGKESNEPVTCSDEDKWYRDYKTTELVQIDADCNEIFRDDLDTFNRSKKFVEIEGKLIKKVHVTGPRTLITDFDACDHCKIANFRAEIIMINGSSISNDYRVQVRVDGTFVRIKREFIQNNQNIQNSSDSMLKNVNIEGYFVKSISDGNGHEVPFTECEDCKKSVFTAKVISAISSIAAIDRIIRVKTDGTFYQIIKRRTINVLDGKADEEVRFDAEGNETVTDFNCTDIKQGSYFRDYITADIFQIQNDCPNLINISEKRSAKNLRRKRNL